MKTKENKYSGVRAHGSGIQIEIKYKGRRYRPTLKMPPTPSNLRDAKRLREKIMHDIVYGRFDPKEYFMYSKAISRMAPGIAVKMTISDIVDDWLLSVERSKDKSTREHKNSIKNHIKPIIGNVLVSELSAPDVRKFQDKLGEKLSAKSVNNVMTVLRQAFKRAYNDELIDKNPMDRVENLKVDKTKTPPLTPSEVDCVLGVIEKRLRVHYLFYKFSIWTGLSTGEQLGLQWSDYDTDSKTIFVQRMWGDGHIKKLKNKYRLRKLELIQPAIDALEELMGIGYGSEWIFVDPSSKCDVLLPWKIDKIAKPWNQALKQCGIAYRRAYVTRHTYASIMLSAGMSIEWLKEKMGHTNYKMLEENYATWVHISLEERKKIRNWVFAQSHSGHIPERDREFFSK